MMKDRDQILEDYAKGCRKEGYITAVLEVIDILNTIEDNHIKVILTRKVLDLVCKN